MWFSLSWPTSTDKSISDSFNNDSSFVYKITEAKVTKNNLQLSLLKISQSFSLELCLKRPRNITYVPLNFCLHPVQIVQINATSVNFYN